MSARLMLSLLGTLARRRFTPFDKLRARGSDFRF